MTSYGCRCGISMSHRRQCDVMRLLGKPHSGLVSLFGMENKKSETCILLKKNGMEGGIQMHFCIQNRTAQLVKSHLLETKPFVKYFLRS